MAPSQKALIAITSAHAPLYPDGKETGIFHIPAYTLLNMW